MDVFLLDTVKIAFSECWFSEDWGKFKGWKWNLTYISSRSGRGEELVLWNVYFCCKERANQALIEDIIMRHPEEKYNKEQAKLLEEATPEKRREMELLFKVGNASIWYHRKAREFKPTIKDWEEWVDGLPDPARTGFRKMGFEKCKTALPFTRYVNEKNDIGFEAFLKENLSEQDFKDYLAISNKRAH